MESQTLLGQRRTEIDGNQSVMLWEEEDCETKLKKRIGFIISITITFIVFIALVVAIVVGWMSIQGTNPSLPDAVTADNCSNILKNLQQLQDNAPSGSRSVLGNYNLSASFIEDQLKSGGVGCEISKQNFSTPIYIEQSPPALVMTVPWYYEFQRGVDFSGLRYGGNSSRSILNASICLVPNGGSQLEDFRSVTNGCVALIELQNVEPFLINKTMTAQNLNASAVILFNNPSMKTLFSGRVRSAGWFPGDPLMTIPVIAASNSVGNFLSVNGPRVNLVTNTTIQIAETFNLFCTTKEGAQNSTVVVGAHLDSVPEGYGINDNGSGSCTLLEIVLKWYALQLEATNRIIFSWWGSEEVGLIGSRHFVRQLQLNNNISDIAMNLNFDMLASPNYYLGIHNGSTAAKAQNGSSVITSFFVEYFVNNDIKYRFVDLLGGSDFLPFLEAGIPAGGLATGASLLKSSDERSLFGGLANAAYDTCYHLPCDTFDNINSQALTYMAGAASYVVQKVAQTNDLLAVLSQPPPPPHTKFLLEEFKRPVPCEEE